MSNKLSEAVFEKIRYFASFPQTSVSLRQMVEFGPRPSAGTLFKATQFLREELPIRLAHRVVELDQLPWDLSHMPSVRRVRDWYAESFAELTEFPRLPTPKELKTRERVNVSLHLAHPPPASPPVGGGAVALEGAVPSPHDVDGIGGAIYSQAPTPPPEGAHYHHHHHYQPYSSHPHNPHHHHHHNYSHAQTAAAAAAGEDGARAAVVEPMAGHRYFTYVPGAVNVSDDVKKYTHDFVELIEKIKRRHDPVVATVAQGIRELKARAGLPVIDERVQAFLDRFYMSRIGIRMLIGQHVALNRMAAGIGDGPVGPFGILGGGGASVPPRENYVGIICTATNIQQVAQEAIDNARFICEDHYALFAAPRVQLYCTPNLHFMYVPSHLHHMLFELLKNSLRAVVERCGPDADQFPPIKIVVAEGKEDITIKISDEGGGIPRSGIPLIWTYLYTTANPDGPSPLNNLAGSVGAAGSIPGTSVAPAELMHEQKQQQQQQQQQQPMSDFKAPMAGFGYGLPLSRLYARYFGGDLRLISMEGYGTDAYLHLSRLSDSEEPLP